jgi:hypothetical protein
VFEHGLVLEGGLEGRGEAPDADLLSWQARRDRCPACAVKAGISNPEVQGGRVPKSVGFVYRRRSLQLCTPATNMPKDIGSENVWPSHEHGRDKLKILEYSFMNGQSSFS